MLTARLLVIPLTAMALMAVPAGAAQTRIVNGSSPSQAWPAQASVVFTTSPGFVGLCAGTLVSARWVLTAGHCATTDSGAQVASGDYAVRVGSTLRTTGGNTTGVDQVVRHPDYVEAGVPTSDLALLHLATAVPQEPLRLIGGAEPELWSAGVPSTIIGWGLTETGFGSEPLVQATAPMVDDAGCVGNFAGFSATTMVCAGGGSTDTCTGDSGGPLMVPRRGAFVLAGVTSWGAFPCAAAGVPGVYARVGAPALNAWIRGLVPTVSLAVSPAVNEQVSLVATPQTPVAQGGTPSLGWDLDDDGQFDDATGPAATRAVAGSTAVRVQSLYPDGDRAVTRELVVGPRPAAPADPVAPVARVQPLPPAPAPAPAPERATLPNPRPAPKPAPIAGTVAVPQRITLGAHMRVRFRCARACTITGRLTLRASAARRFGLRTAGRAVIVGSGRAALTAGGRGVMTVRLTTRARRALRNRTRATIYLRTELLATGARLARTSSITVRR